MSTLTLSVPVPPSTNNASMSVMQAGRPRQVMPAAQQSQPWPTPPYSAHRLSLELTAWYSDHRRRDLSTCSPLGEDAIAEHIGVADRTIVVLFIRRGGVDRVQPRCEIKVEVLS